MIPDKALIDLAHEMNYEYTETLSKHSKPVRTAKSGADPASPQVQNVHKRFSSQLPTHIKVFFIKCFEMQHSAELVLFFQFRLTTLALMTIYRGLKSIHTPERFSNMNVATILIRKPWNMYIYKDILFFSKF